MGVIAQLLLVAMTTTAGASGGPPPGETAAPAALPPDRSALVARLADGVSADAISTSMKRLGEFTTRHLYSGGMGEGRGIAAARDWIAETFRKASPRLEVRLESRRIAPSGPRLPREVTLHNVVAVLPAATPEGRGRNVLVTAHYDTVAAGPDGRVDWSRWDVPAPGVNDDGSGTAVVLEAARVLAGGSFDANIMFIAFAGEEQGLVGSTLHAKAARAAGTRIEAVLNNDIVGGETGGDGRTDGGTVRLFSEGPEDSPSRELARFVSEVAARYLPSFTVDAIFRADRFGRGGDHTPFNQFGFPAVRLTVAVEDYSRQHSGRDDFEGTSPAYAARVARLNVAALATLASAPPAPLVTDEKGAPTIDRGPSGYDARLRWKAGGPAADLAGYKVLVRETTAPAWQRSYWAGPVEGFVLPGVPIDRLTFGVRAVDREGHESPAAVYVMPARPPAEYTELP